MSIHIEVQRTLCGRVYILSSCLIAFTLVAGAFGFRAIAADYHTSNVGLTLMLYGLIFSCCVLATEWAHRRPFNERVCALAVAVTVPAAGALLLASSLICLTMIGLLLDPREPQRNSRRGLLFQAVLGIFLEYYTSPLTPALILRGMLALETRRLSRLEALVVLPASHRDYVALIEPSERVTLSNFAPSRSWVLVVGVACLSVHAVVVGATYAQFLVAYSRAAPFGGIVAMIVLAALTVWPWIRYARAGMQPGRTELAVKVATSLHVLIGSGFFAVALLKPGMNRYGLLIIFGLPFVAAGLTTWGVLYWRKIHMAQEQYNLTQEVDACLSESADA
jgi:hypothetical protein